MANFFDYLKENFNNYIEGNVKRINDRIKAQNTKVVSTPKNSIRNSVTPAKATISSPVTQKTQRKVNTPTNVQIPQYPTDLNVTVPNVPLEETLLSNKDGSLQNNLLRDKFGTPIDYSKQFDALSDDIKWDMNKNFESQKIQSEFEKMSPSERTLWGMVGTANNAVQFPLRAYDSLKQFASENAKSINERTYQKLLNEAKTKGASEKELNDIYQKMETNRNAETFKADAKDNLSSQLDLINKSMIASSMNTGTAFDKKVNETANMVTDFVTTMGMSKVANIGYLLLSAANSGTDKAYQLMEEGYDAETSLGNGAISGAVNYLVEYLPIDNLLKNKLGQFGLAFIATQAIEEGGEEFLQYYAEPIIDKFTLGKEIEYNTGDAIQAALMGAYGGSVIGSMYTWKPTLKHRRTVNQLKADMDTLSEFQRTNTLTPEENSAIDEVIRLSEKAIKDFNAKSVIGDAIKMEKDQVTPKNAREIQNNLYKFLQPEIDHENQNRINAQNTISNIQKNAQEILSLKGIKMDALQYSMLEDGVRKQVDKVQNYANELGVNLVFDTNAGSDGMYDPNTGTVIIDPNSDLGALTVFTHELTHGTESSRFYEPLKNMILNENTPESIEQGIQRIKEVYSSDGVNLDDDGALKEYVAIQTQELLGNDKFVKRLVKYNNSLAYRIYDGIKNLVSKTDTLKDIEYNFLKAFRDSGMNPEVNTELQLDPQYLLRRLNKDAIDEDGKVKSITSQLKDFFSGKFGTRDKLIAKTDSKGLEPYGIDPNLPMTMDQSVIKKIFRDPVKGGHNDSIDESVIEYVVNHPEDIAFAVKNNWGNYAFIYDFNGKNGSPILMSVQPSEDSGQGLVINNITSMYGKDDLQNYIDDVASRGFEIMLNEKSGTFAGVRGVQFPNAFQQVTTSNDNISNSNEDVKKYSKGLREKDILNTNNYDNIDTGEQDDFRRIQEESRRVYAEKLQSEMGYELNENERTRIKRSLRRELERRGYSDSSNHGINVIRLGDSSDATKTYNLYDNVDGQTFRDMFEIARAYTKNGELVDIHDVETTEYGIGYNDCKNYLSDDGLSGFSITPDGDLISVFNAKTINGKKGFLKAISPIVKENTKTLDCFVSPYQPLNKMYEDVFGFKTASIMDYNMEYDHDNIAINHNKPQVAFMVNTNQDIETKHFDKNQYEEALEYRNSFVDKDVKYSKGLNPKDLTESSFKTLSKDYNIKDPKLRELYDEMIDDIKTSGIVFNDTYDNIVDYIVNNSKEKVENSLKEEAKKYFGGKTFYLPPNYSRDISGENMFETNRSLPNGIRLTKNFAKDHLDSALNEFIEMNGIGEQWGINTQDQFNSLLDLLRSDDNALKKNIYGKELFEQEVKYDIDKIIDSITTQTEAQSNKGITPEDINKVADADLNDIDIQNIFSNRREKIDKRKIERIEKMKEKMIDAAQEWIPNYDVLRNKYDEIDLVSFNKALFQTLVYGEVDEDIKADIKQQILEQSFADEKYNKTVESFLDDVLEHFSTDAIYQNDKRYMGSIAQKVNNILKGYDGFTEGTYEENYKYVESMKKAQETIGKNRKEIFDYNEDDYKNLVNVGKDYGSHWKTLSQNLDVIANKNANLRTKLSDMFELPFYNAQTSTVNALQKYNDVISSITRDLDIREGSKESKATQWMLEKKKENGSVYDEDLLKKEFDYQMKNGKKAYENIMEASKKLRDAYDEIFNTINKQRSDIYGEIEIENMMDTEKLRAKVSEAKKMVNNIEEQLAYKPSPELQAGYDKAKKEYTKLVNQLNTKLSQDASDDSTRRQKLPYRENYAHHVIKRNGFFKGLVNAIRGGRKVPTKLSGISDYAKPKTGFANFFIQQKGGEYEADAIGGFADYIKSASRIIGYDPLVNYYRNVANDIRSVAKGNEMSSFVNWLSDYTNSLAGKTNETDRAFRKLGPRFINAVGQLNQRVIRNSLMFNLRTAITQIGNIPNGFGVLTKNGGVKSSLDIAKGATDFAKNIFDNKSAPHLQSPFLSSRYFDADTRKLGVKAKAEEVANFMLSKGDELSTKLIWYSAYDQAIRKGEQDPIMYADDITRRSVAGRNFGELPLAMQSKMINLAIPFQVEVNNAYQTLKGMISTKEGVGGLVTILLADWLLNNLFEELWGDRVLFDPIDVIAKSIEEENGLIDTTTRLGGELLSNMPGGNLLTSTLLGLDEKQRKKLFGESDPSRYGLGNIGLKGLGEIAYDALNGNLDDATSNLIASYLMPGGGKQAQRSIEALQTYGILPQINDGKLVKEPIYYTKSGKIGFVQDEPQENIFDFMKNVAFGKWAGEKGREYIDGGFKSLTDTQGELFKAFSDVIGARQNKEVIDEIKSVESLKDEDGKTVTNSKGLEIRNIMEREGLWEAYKDSFSEEETTRFDVGKKVYGMTSEEFFKEYERVFGGKKEEDKESVQEPKKEPTYTYYEEENIQDFANKNGLSKDKADEINDIIAYREALTDENGKTVRNSAALKVRKQFVKMGVYDDIVSYINENGLKAGDFGLNKTVIAYDENEFNQKYSEMYEGKTYNQTEYTPKKKTSKRTSSKSYKKEYEKIINAFTKSTQTPEETYKKINKILDDYVFNDDIKKSTEDIRKKYLKEGLYDLIKKYLKDNPYADASAFGL